MKYTDCPNTYFTRKKYYNVRILRRLLNYNITKKKKPTNFTVTSQDHSFNPMFYSSTKTVRLFCICKPLWI